MPTASAVVRRALIGWIAVLVAAAAGIAFAGGAGAQDAEAPERAQPANGALIYAEQCAQCHGARGQGGPMQRYEGMAPSLLPTENPAVDAAYIELVTSTGRMPPAGSPYDNRSRRVVLDEQERRDLIAWMQQEFDTPGEVPEVGEGDAARGQEVWNANCAHCHGAIGSGGVAGAGAWTPSVSDKAPEQIAAAIRVGPFQMPQFQRGQISDEEVADVVAFMEVVREEADEQPLGFAELNPVFASAFVFLLALVAVFLLAVIGGRPAWYPTPEADRRGGGEGDDVVPAGAERRSTEEDEQAPVIASTAEAATTDGEEQR
jgi:ubiquinol-cytochrome c reductase cytochrome c subunit